jgi:hypothetical protein
MMKHFSCKTYMLVNDEHVVLLVSKFHLCRMNLIHQHYDANHRAHWMADKKTVRKFCFVCCICFGSWKSFNFQICHIFKVFGPLRLRSHEASNTTKRMIYDERYTPYIERLGLLPFIHLVTRSTPNFNPSAITALVDRWRPETHTFHLRTGEMTVTLQDVSMILALPIDGLPLCINTDSEDWRGHMYDLIGKAPPVPADTSKDRMPAGATFSWIIANFKTCPVDASDEVVEQYARVYAWYVITRSLFADGGGRTAQWMWLKALTVWDQHWSWGTAALAYLYRQVIMCS